MLKYTNILIIYNLLKNIKFKLIINYFIKERLLEFIAVGKMTGNISGKVLCLIGPPGTGKTSLGSSIAK